MNELAAELVEFERVAFDELKIGSDCQRCHQCRVLAAIATESGRERQPQRIDESAKP